MGPSRHLEIIGPYAPQQGCGPNSGELQELWASDSAGRENDLFSDGGSRALVLEKEIDRRCPAAGEFQFMHMCVSKDRQVGSLSRRCQKSADSAETKSALLIDLEV